MPFARNYNPGSIVYFQEDKGDDIFLLQKGSIVLISDVVGELVEKRETVKTGEFFGVKSGLGHYPREETAQAISATSLVVFKSNEFESYIVRNTRLIIKMLQVFSRELRNIHKRLRSILQVEGEKNPAFELINIADGFYKSHSFEYAAYAFKCYLKNYPDGKNKKRAEELLQMVQQNMPYPTAYPSPEQEYEPIPALETQKKSESSAIHESSTKIERESQTSVIKALFESAQEAMAQGRFQDAIQKLQRCLEEKMPKTKKENEIYEQAQFELGMAMIKAKRIKESGAAFSKYLKTYPTGDYVRNCIYQLGVLQELQENKEQARILYHKVATMQPHDALTMKARQSLQRISPK